MVQILFVCHGNICRSPMAEFMMKDLVARRNLADRFLIASAGTSTEELGNPIYPHAADALTRHGVPFDARQAVQLQRSDYDKYDFLLGLDKWNISNMLRILGGDPQRKVLRLLDFSDIPRDVADPWYTRKFDVTYEDILEGCKFLFNHLLRSHLI